jgi:hypothetical protein
VGQARLFEGDLGDVVGREAAVGGGVVVVVTQVDLVVVDVVVDVVVVGTGRGRGRGTAGAGPGLATVTSAARSAATPALRRAGGIRPVGAGVGTAVASDRIGRRFGGCPRRIRRRFAPRERGRVGGDLGRARGEGRLRDRLVGHWFLLS